MPHIPQSVTRLLVVPDGSLAHLPFDLLREEGGKELGERYRVSFSPSVSVSVLAAGRGGVGKERLLAFGGAWYARDKAVAVRGERAVSFGEETLEGVGTVSGGPRWWDLPGTEAEVKGLEELGYREGAPKVMLGKEASEGKVKELSLNGELKGYGLVHFAGHGYFNEEDIGRSGIVLSEVSGLIESEEDGYLTISEAAVLEMGSRIVVLSGCETGLGKVKRGDGVVGLARAFMVAGSDGVGVSLWSISDEATVEFMRGVYGRVIEGGKSFGEAYQEEKWEFRGRGGEWRHPYYWAGFMLYE
jgi:CHAT domain-containing protein